MKPFRKLTRNGIVAPRIGRIMLETDRKCVRHELGIKTGRGKCIPKGHADPNAPQQSVSVRRAVVYGVPRNGMDAGVTPEFGYAQTVDDTSSRVVAGDAEDDREHEIGGDVRARITVNVDVQVI